MVNIFAEGGDGFATFARSGKEQPECIQVYKEAKVVVAPFSCGFIPADAPDTGVILLGPRLFSVMVEDTLKSLGRARPPVRPSFTVRS